MPTAPSQAPVMPRAMGGAGQPPGPPALALGTWLSPPAWAQQGLTPLTCLAAKSTACQRVENAVRDKERWAAGAHFSWQVRSFAGLAPE